MSGKTAFEERLLFCRDTFNSILTRQFLPQFRQELSGNPRHNSKSYLVKKKMADTLEYALDAPGKRLRPFLAYLGYQVFAKDLLTEIPASLFRLQLAVECIHTYSLVHDDLPVMDNDDLRRGRPTLHKQFSVAEALLAGDALNAWSFPLVADAAAECPTYLAPLLMLVHNGANFGGMVLGQLADMSAEDWPVFECTTDDLNFIHYHKTAALITASFLSGYLLGYAHSLGTAAEQTGRQRNQQGQASPSPSPSPPSELDANEHSKGTRPDVLLGCQPLLSPDIFGELQAWQDFCLELGLYFQIKDDLLDIQADAATMGKNPGQDEDKLTYVTLLGEKEAQDYLHQTRNRLLAQLDSVSNQAGIAQRPGAASVKNLWHDTIAYIGRRRS